MIKHGDFLENSKLIESESVDLIIADPPFNLKKDYNTSKDSLSRSDYIKWCERWLIQCDRILKPTGSIYVMNTQENAWIIQRTLEDIGMYFRNTIAWKNSSMPIKNRYCINYQPIVYFAKTKKYTFNYGVQTKHSDAAMPWGRKKHKHSMTDNWDDIPFISGGCMASKEAILIEGTKKKLHPCQMPVALAERMVLYSSNKGDTVLDPFSGTVAVACVRNDRSYVSFELDDTFYLSSLERVKKEVEEREKLLF